MNELLREMILHELHTPMPRRVRIQWWLHYRGLWPFRYNALKRPR